MDYFHSATSTQKDSSTSTGQVPCFVSSSGQGHPSAGACAYPPVPESEIFQTEQFSDEMDRSGTLSDSEDGQLSDSTEPQEQMEDMTYRETVRSVRSFMGWHHIPTFESDYSEPDESNNLWKGKHPRKPSRISVSMPLDNWLCQKLERLNLTVAEGYRHGHKTLLA